MAAPQTSEYEESSAQDSAVEDAFFAQLQAEDGEEPEESAPKKAKAPPEATADDAALDADAAENADEEEATEEEGPEAVEAKEPEADEDEGIQTLSDLAKSFEVEESEFLDHIQVQLGDETVSLAKALEAARTPIEDRVERGVRAKLAEYTPKREAELSGLAEQRKQLLAATERILAESEVMFKNLNWQQLEREEPAEYAQKYVLREKYRHLVGESLGLLQAQREKGEKAENERIQEWRESEHRALLELPEFKHWGTDTAKATAEIKQLGEYLLKQGFDQETVADLVEHRMVRTAWKAMKYDENRSRTLLAKSKLKTIPKALVQGARQPKHDPKAKRTQSLLRRLGKSGDYKDAADLFMEDGTLD